MTSGGADAADDPVTIGSERAVDDLPEWTNNAVFIYGARKSGTTLLTNLHDGGEELVVFPLEVKLKQLSRLPWAAGDPHDAYYSFSRVLGDEHPNFDDDGYASAVASRRPPIHSLRDALRYDVALLAESITAPPPRLTSWAMKEVGGNPVELISLFRCLFFEGRVVMILREPRMSTRAFLRSLRRDGKRLSLSTIVEHAVDPMRILRTQVSMLDDPTIHFVAYEDLVADTSEVMRGVAEYLGIDYNDVFERPTIFGEPVVVRTSSRELTSVFHDEARWFNGLTVREIVVVSVAGALFRMRLRARGGRVPDYTAIRERIKTRTSASR